jgi:hypothetical protein
MYEQDQNCVCELFISSSAYPCFFLYKVYVAVYLPSL